VLDADLRCQLHGLVLAQDSGEAADRFDEALGADLTRWPLQRARLLLAYGQWLRRQRRIADSRASLRQARDAFDAMAAPPGTPRPAASCGRPENPAPGASSPPPTS